jgi:SAM-dependent MidA family methyltransferase
MAEFALWQRENLERLTYELVEDNQRLREDNKMLLEQWRKALTEKCQDEALAGSPDPRWPSQ